MPKGKDGFLEAIEGAVKKALVAHDEERRKAGPPSKGRGKISEPPIKPESGWWDAFGEWWDDEDAPAVVGGEA